MQWTLRLLVVSGMTLGVALPLLLFPDRALANAGPHGGFSPDTDKCAACHRAHTAVGPSLITEANEDTLCISCHGGTGASTNVLSGSSAGGGKLNGGGFVSYGGAAVTSAHNLDTMGGRGGAPAWGGGTSGPGIGSDSALRCTSCHNPHGSSNYRILRDSADPAWDSAGAWPSGVSGSSSYDSGGAGPSISSWCATCHTQYMTTTSTYDAGDGKGEVPRYRHKIFGNPSCATCHFAHGTTATMSSYATNVLPAAGSTLLKRDSRGVCTPCHVRDGVVGGGGACDSCHGAPPATGAHLKHFAAGNADLASYGGMGNISPSGGSYVFGCGECHPTDSAKHLDGTVEVELSGSEGLKAKSPTGSYTPGGTVATDDQDISYTLGTCRNTYCHSSTQVSSGAVPTPIISGGLPVLDANGNLTYSAYSVWTSTSYRTMNWGDGPLGCSSCHSNPPRSSTPGVQAGVGQSHSWIDNYGYENLHAWNMSFAPLSCRTCHYGTVTQANTYTRNGMDVATQSDVPIANSAAHVNGQNDVQFDTANPVTYRHSFSLAGMTWNAGTKTCANAACHLRQTTPEWGKPYRWWNQTECDQCHRYGNWPAQGQSVGPQATGTAASNHPAVAEGIGCVSCHKDGGH